MCVGQRFVHAGCGLLPGWLVGCVGVQTASAGFALRSSAPQSPAPHPSTPLRGPLLALRPLLLPFIFISPEEMQAVADFIRQRGRIAIGELAAKSSQFVDLEARQVAGAAAELELALPVAGS